MKTVSVNAMNLKKILSAALIASSVLAAAGCASDGHRRTGGEVIDDTAITAKVRAALLAEPDVKSFEIKAETFEGTVQLSGFVDSQWQIDKAGQVAMSVNGVKHVKNNLVHKPN